MLQITGKWLGMTTETKRPGPGQTWQPFDATTISLMTEGPGGRPAIEELQAGRELDLASLARIEDDDTVTFQVSISAFNTRYGGDYRLNASALVAVQGDAAEDADSGWPRAVAGSETGF